MDDMRYTCSQVSLAMRRLSLCGTARLVDFASDYGAALAPRHFPTRTEYPFDDRDREGVKKVKVKIFKLLVRCGADINWHAYEQGKRTPLMAMPLSFGHETRISVSAGTANEVCEHREAGGAEPMAGLDAGVLGMSHFYPSRAGWSPQSPSWSVLMRKVPATESIVLLSRDAQVGQCDVQGFGDRVHAGA
ncbi:hypothetical protein FVE85_8675 [Porphyridium purpureum]|uniref:Uncharacterized protein n=1 Tax=Porphyridium purpureum TaxID=35688 RepID=A0A5J4YQG4_PORPP|nr:hypothetical protein FVE85_8675 [Porphyridium purpureum]|eukprot:POR3833..scf296_7